jgi:hypothetical protein
LGEIDNYYEFYNNIDSNYKINKRDIIELNLVKKEFVKLENNFRNLINNSKDIKDSNILFDKINNEIDKIERWC